MPEISVVIPTHNRRHVLPRTLAGVLAQKDVDLEVVVVIDGSTDGTYEFLKQVPDNRLRLLHHPTAQGVVRARNAGIEQARGHWLAFVDDDDLWAPRKLREQIDAADMHGGTVVYSTAIIVSTTLDPLELHTAPPATTIQRDILRRMLIPGGASNLIAQRSLVREVGGFDERLHAAADWDCWIRLIRTGRPVDCQQIHVGYVVHESNMSVVDADRFLSEHEIIHAKYRAEREAEGVSIDGVTFTRWLAGSFRRGGDTRGAIRTYMIGARRFHSPGNLIRAAGTMLGERAMRIGSRGRRRIQIVGPEWLDLYRPEGPFDLDAAGLSLTSEDR